MKIEVRYQSRGGNTKAVAAIIAHEFDITAQSVEIPITEYTDILFLGGGVYEWQMDKTLHEFMNRLDSQKIGQIICFSTTGYMNSTIEQMKHIAEKKGIAINKNELLIKMLLRGHSWLRCEGGNLSDKQITSVINFVKKIKEEIL